MFVEAFRRRVKAGCVDRVRKGVVRKGWGWKEVCVAGADASNPEFAVVCCEYNDVRQGEEKAVNTSGPVCCSREM